MLALRSAGHAKMSTHGTANAVIGCVARPSPQASAASSSAREDPVRPARSAATSASALQKSARSWTSARTARVQTVSPAANANAAKSPVSALPVIERTSDQSSHALPALASAEKSERRQAGAPIAKTWLKSQPPRTKSGNPVGCGIPSRYGTVSISPVSQKATPGDKVATYNASGPTKAAQPERELASVPRRIEGARLAS